MIAILRGGPIAPLVGVPRELEAVILRALARSPSARYLTADEMTAALMPFVPQAELNVVATTAMASRAPRSLTPVDTSGTTASTPGLTAPTPTTAPTAPTTTRSSSPALAPTFAQTRDQTAVHRENVHLQAAHPHAFAHASARPPAFGPAGYAPLANAPAFAGLAPVAAPVAAKGGASSRHALFVALGVVALVALGVVARIEPSFLGSAAPRAETNAPATNVTPRMDGSCASDADCATLTHACGPCASGDLVAGVSRTNCVVNPCPKARVVCGPAHRCIVE